MNLSEKALQQSDLSISSRQTARKPKVRGILRLTMALIIAAVVLSVPTGSRVLAKGGYQAAAPDIDPGAMEALNKLGVYLRSLTAFQVEADITADDVLENGQTIQGTKKVNLVAVKPNKLRVEITSDDEHRFLFFDGKNFTVYGMLVNYYATVPVTGTTAELVNRIDDKYGIELPLVDLFKWGTNESDTKKIKTAIDVGATSVGGVTCEQYAFHQDGADWQIWIQLGQFPLPRKLVIRTLTDEARPQYSEILTWNLAPSFSEDAFTFNPPADAKRIAFEEAKSADAK